MCLAIPGKILKVNKENVADVDFNGIIRKVSLDLTNNAKVGDYVLVHAGFAIECLSQEEAKKSLQLLKELEETTN